MVDVFSPAKRSAIMSSIKGQNTMPEVLVRKIVHSLGYRFRLHNKALAGKPDIVLPRHKKIIFVHGCFWHGHMNCPRSTLPSTQTIFWRSKIERNRLRDIKTSRQLRRQGWAILVVWQCQTKNMATLTRRLERFLIRVCHS